MTNRLLAHARTLTRSVTTALQVHARTAADDLDAQREAVGARPLQLAVPLEVAQHDIEASLQALSEADFALSRETHEDADAREARDAIFARLFDRVSATSQGIYLLYGAEGLKRLRLHGSTPQTHERLVSFARGFVIASTPLPPLPTPRHAFQTLHIEAARDAISADTDALDASITALTRETRQTQLLRVDRDKALLAWRRHLTLAIALTRATLVFNGQRELADRVLPTDRQVARNNPEPQPEAPDTPEPAPTA